MFKFLKKSKVSSEGSQIKSSRKELNINPPSIPNRIMEYITDEEKTRAYAFSVDISLDGISDEFYLRTPNDFPRWMREWITPVIEHPGILEMTMYDNTINVTLTDAYESYWYELRDFIVNNFNKFIFDGNAKVEVVDDRSARQYSSMFPPQERMGPPGFGGFGSPF